MAPRGFQTSSAPVPGRKLAVALLLRVLWAAALVLHALGAQAGVVFTSLHSFGVCTNGQLPYAGLVQGSDGNFYGTTSGGGTNGGFGTVVKISINGPLTTLLYSFTGGNDGGNPQAGLVPGNDGNFYGTTTGGGIKGSGTVFKLGTNGSLITLYSFTNGNDGGTPRDGLALGGDGNFYGMTTGGGLNGAGTVFQISSNGALNTLYSFPDGGGNQDPAGRLVQGADGYFYGENPNGGGYGTVFKIGTNGATTTLHTFNGTDGYWPRGGLVQAGDGYLYGTTTGWVGSTGDRNGSIFRISTNGTFTTMHYFTFTGGYYPNGLLQGSDGNFYGTTFHNGNNQGFGTVFKFTSDGTLTPLYTFGSITDGHGDPLDGSNPMAGLVQGTDGNLYGTTLFGGMTHGYGTFGGSGRYGAGSVFQISTNGGLNTLYSFGSSDGANPNGLVQGSDGNFYGTASGGGAIGFGDVFKITTNGVLTTLYSFNGLSDGGFPNAGLIQGNDGNFYGTSQNESYYSVNKFNTVFFAHVFEISTNGALTTLFSFPSATGLHAGLVQGSNGNLYGITENLGAHNDGGVFQMNPAGSLSFLYSFTASAYPNWLIQATDGNLYVTSGSGGNYSHGSVFKVSTNGAFTSLYSFTGGNDGSQPQAGLVQGSDGNFYGTTYAGGAITNRYGQGQGTVFKISTTGTLTTLYSFTGGNDGSSPGGLIQGSDGNFYGTARSGTNGGSGSVFQLGTNGALTTLYSFTGGSDGASPNWLLQGSDGRFYGTASGGGVGGAGIVFRLTIVPAFQAVTLTNSTLSLTWSTEPGGMYQLQFNSDLTSTNWTNLGSPIPATGVTLNTTDSLTNAPQRFYRLVLSP